MSRLLLFICIRRFDRIADSKEIADATNQIIKVSFIVLNAVFACNDDVYIYKQFDKRLSKVFVYRALRSLEC